MKYGMTFNGCHTTPNTCYSEIKQKSKWLPLSTEKKKKKKKKRVYFHDKIETNPQAYKLSLTRDSKKH